MRLHRNRDLRPNTGFRQRRRLKPDLRWIIAAVCVIVLAIAAAVVIHGRLSDKEATGEISETGEGALPTVCFEYNGQYINRCHGYLSDMNVSTMHENLLPLDSDRAVKMNIDPVEETVTDIGYELLSTDGSELVASDDGIESVSDDEGLTAEFSIPGVMSSGAEYMLKVTLETESGKSIDYYTRVRICDDIYMAEMMDFANDFSEATFKGSEGTGNIIPYMESDSSAADNTNLAYTDLKSSVSQVIWADLSPEISGDIRVNVSEVESFSGGSSASIVREYDITASDENGIEKTYAVHEYYLMRQYDAVTTYLLVFQRTVEDITPLSVDSVKQGVVDLGITDKAYDYAVQTAGKYAVFEHGGALWEYDSKTGEVTRMFDLGSDSTGVYADGDDHRYSIISIDEENGDVAFSVYGYMPSGVREGHCGMGVYTYTGGNTVNEEFFVDMERSYEVISAEIGSMTASDSNGVYYLRCGSCIYALYSGDQELTMIASGLGADGVAISSDGTRIAWAEGVGTYGYGSVYMLDIENGVQLEPVSSSESGDEMKIIGFSGHDLVCGRLNTSDSGYMNGSEICPMYELVIYSESGVEDGTDTDIEEETASVDVEDISMEEVSAYSLDGCYITSATADDNHIVIQRATRSGNEYTGADEDTLMRVNEVTQDDASTYLASTTAEIRQKVYSYELFPDADTLEMASEIGVHSVTGVNVTRTECLKLIGQSEVSGIYYAYACGSLRGAYSVYEDAVNAVYSDMGIVKDSEQRTVWTRLSSATS